MHICFKPEFGRMVSKTRFQWGIHQGTLEMLPMCLRKKIARIINKLKQAEEIILHINGEKAKIFITGAPEGCKTTLCLLGLEMSAKLIACLPEMVRHLTDEDCQMLPIHGGDISLYVK